MTAIEARQIVWSLVADRVAFYRRHNGDAKFDVLTANVVRSICAPGDAAAIEVTRFARAMLVGIELDELDTPDGQQRYRRAVRFARRTSGVELLLVPAAEPDAEAEAAS